ncbi:MAG: glycosyltransferase [Methanogenium sp.]
MIIHILPENTSPCGGIKVHYELCEIERELGIHSVVAFPNKNNIPKWFKRNTGKILSYAEAKELGYKDKKKGKDVLVIGWEDPEPLNIYFPDFIHACYIQGDVFWKGIFNYPNKYILCSSNYIRNTISGAPFSVVNPFIHTDVFYTSPDIKKFDKKPYKVVIQERKGGKEALSKILSLVPSNFYKDKFNFKVIKDTTEEKFSKELREADVYIAHSFPEGFGLPPLEAMSSSTLVIGFTGGGGVEFLKQGENSFYASDGDYPGVIKILEKILIMEPSQLRLIAYNGYKTSQQYSKENTKQQLISFLRTIKNASL